MPDLTTVCADPNTLKAESNQTRRRTQPKNTNSKPKKYRCSNTNPWQNANERDNKYANIPMDPAESYMHSITR
jgi:hypothetical protein